MKVVIVGCGRMGRGLAKLLDRRGDQVTIIDKNEEAFKELGSHYNGEKITGYGADKEVLEAAGIDRTDALVTCTSNDEVNALVARTARIFYQVPQVIARLYDPHKANIYNALGIRVLSTTSWGIRYTAEILSYTQLDIIQELGNGSVKLVRIEVDYLLAGRTVQSLNKMGQCMVSAMRRGNDTYMPTDGTLLEAGDCLFLMVQSDYISSLKKTLGHQ